MRHYLWFQGPSSSSYSYNSLANGAGYSFEWNVYDAYNQFGHREDRKLGQSGTDETRGSYHVLLPDGRVQTVTYFVDPYNGYQVRYIYLPGLLLIGAHLPGYTNRVS